AHRNQGGAAAGNGRSPVAVAVSAGATSRNVNYVGVNQIFRAAAGLIYKELHETNDRLLGATVSGAELPISTKYGNGHQRGALADSDGAGRVVGIIAPGCNLKRRRIIVVHRVLAVRSANQIVDALLGGANLVASDGIYRATAGERCLRRTGFDFIFVNLAATAAACEAYVIILAGSRVNVQCPRFSNHSSLSAIPPGRICDLSVLDQVCLPSASRIDGPRLVLIAVGHQPWLDAPSAEG